MKPKWDILVFYVLVLLLSGLLSGCTQKADQSDTDTLSKTQNIQQSPYDGKKILYVDSYHEGYEWSDGISSGIKRVLDGTGVELKVIRMDTKRNDSDQFGIQAGLIAKSVIEDFRPDVVIVSDDPAFKYLVKPYYKDAGLPFVSCAVNWDISIYGAPYNNTAVMLEVSLTSQLLSFLKEYSKGERIGFLAGNTTTDKKNAEYHSKLFNITFARVYHVNTFDEWKAMFLKLQDDADLAILENKAGIKGWNDSEAEAFVLKNAKIPAGTFQVHMTNYALIGLTKIPEEQGEWSAKTALRILDGTKPSDIPITQNQRGKLIANMKIADKLGVTLSPYFITNAELIT